MAHCGSSLEGDFNWNVTYIDIFSGWTSLRAVSNKGAHGIVEATCEVEAVLPFAIEGRSIGRFFLRSTYLRLCRLRSPPRMWPEFTHSSFTHELNESKLVASYPTEAAELLLAFLRRSPKWFHVGKDAREFCSGPVGAKVSVHLLDETRSHLVKLGGNLDDFAI